MDAQDAARPTAETATNRPHRIESAKPSALFEKEEIEQSIPERFAKMVRLHSSRLAVRAGQQSLTYCELDRATDCLARYILSRESEPGECVAFLLERDVWQIVALLAILKAGRIAVPLDGTLPAARLESILRNSQARLIVTDNAHRELCKEVAGGRCTLVDTRDIDARSSGAQPLRAPRPDAFAYLLYTSGSTGQPKGVIQNHRNALHFVRNYSAGLRITADERLSLLPSIAFSAAMMDIFAALLNGGSLHVYDFRRDGLGRLAEWLVKEEITIYHSSPIVFRHFVSTLSGGKEFSRLRAIDLGGDSVYKRDVDLFKAHFSPACVLVNGFGCTELNCIRQLRIDRDTEVNDAIVPVGYAVEDTEVALVNEAGEAVAENEVGEILVRSRYLVPGYWRLPELTRQLFRNDPDGRDARTFVTGDLGIMLPGGCLVHVGRKDFQVKIRGQRIELAEIEAALLSHASVREAVVVARDDRGGDRRLAAYVVPRGTTTLQGREVRDFLRQRLPAAMVPSFFKCLEALPVLSNGKVDRRSLLSLEASSLPARSGYVAPCTPIEQRLAAIWTRLLGVKRVGLCDNFFDLGGDSLLAMGMAVEVEAAFGRRLPLSLLLLAPTFGQLAQYIERQEEARASHSLVELQPEGDQPPLFAAHSITGDLLFYRDLVRHLGPRQPVFGFQPPSNGGIVKPFARLDEMAAFYVQLLRTVQPVGPYSLMGFSYGGKVALEMAQQIYAGGDLVNLLAIIDTGPTRWTSLLAGGAFPAVTRFIANLPPWFVDDLLRSQRKTLRSRVLSLFRRIGRRARDSFRYTSRQGPTVSAEDIWEVDGLPPSARNVVLTHFEAWRNYAPKSYPGRVLLLRARAQPLLHPGTPDLGWRELASEGVEVKVIPGNHESIVREPQVALLAEELGAALGRRGRTA